MRGRLSKGKGTGILGANPRAPPRFSRVRNPASLSFQTPATQATEAQFLVEKYGNWEMNSENTF